jgi:hypothetical protein
VAVDVGMETKNGDAWAVEICCRQPAGGSLAAPLCGDIGRAAQPLAPARRFELCQVATPLVTASPS